MDGAGEIQGWIEAARRGDPSAFESLVRTYQRPLFRLVFQMVPSREDAEDILQETFYRFYLALGRLRVGEDPLPFLRTVAVRRTYTFLRRNRHRHESLEDLPENLPQLAIEGFQLGVRDVYLWAEGLPEARRLVFLLREVLGVEDAEVARLMGIRQPTVRRHAQLALQDLKKTFGRG